MNHFSTGVTMVPHKIILEFDGWLDPVERFFLVHLTLQTVMLTLNNASF